MLGPTMRTLTALLLCALCALPGDPLARQASSREPYRGLTVTARDETSPRRIRIHVARVDLAAPGVRVALTPPDGPLEVVRKTTAEHVRAAGAALGVNAHYFLPFPSAQLEADLIGLAVSEGRAVSPFETPVQRYALRADAPAINIDRNNHASVVHRDPGDATGAKVREPVDLWTAVAGSAQIVTDGEVTIPVYRDSTHADGPLIPGGPGQYDNTRSWYEAINARTALGISRDGRMLTIVVVDARGGSLGMTVREVASFLIRELEVWQAINLDGGGSSSFVLTDPESGVPRLLSVSADGAAGRAVGSSLLVFAPRHSR
jgi:hypothetical protein